MGRAITDIKPQQSITDRFLSRSARIFVDAVRYPNEQVDLDTFDQVLIVSGPEVIGGTVAVLALGDCTIGHKFLPALDLLHGVEMVRLFRDHAELRQTDRLDETKLYELAEDGVPAAQFHEGFVRGLGRGAPEDRGGAIAWFKRAAETGHAPAMLALGMALAGPGILKDDARMLGKPPRRDAFTDLPQACYWLTKAARSQDPLVSSMAPVSLATDLVPDASRQDRRRCKELLRVQ